MHVGCQVLGVRDCDSAPRGVSPGGAGNTWGQCGVPSPQCGGDGTVGVPWRPLANSRHRGADLSSAWR
jgi:hypothetical protein